MTVLNSQAQNRAYFEARPFDPHRNVLGTRFLSGLFALALLGACDRPGDSTSDSDSSGNRASDSDSSDDSFDTDTASDSEETPLAPLVWKDCPLFTYTGVGSAQCATVSRPLRRDADLGEIDIFVKRLPAKRTSRGQVWILGGGPGVSSSAYEQRMSDWSSFADDFDFYTLDHRGVERSTALTCKALQTSVWPDFAGDCAAELVATWTTEGLAGFSSWEAAHDVIDLIKATRTKGQSVFVCGTSYGGIWLNRVVQLDPTLATAVIFDSPASPRKLESHAQWSALGEDAGGRLLQDCVADVTCAQHLGSKPLGFARAALDKMGTCPGGWRDTTSLQAMDLFHHALNFPDARALLPAVIARLNRCSEDDFTVYTKFSDHVVFRRKDTGARAGGTSNYLLFSLVRFSELISRRSTDQEIDALAKSLVFFRAENERGEGLVADNWVTYKENDLPSDWAEEMPPFLFFYGSYDPKTPFAIAAQAKKLFSSPEYQFVEIPNGGHGALSDLYNTPEALACAHKILAQFLRDPGAPLDTQCLEGVARADFNSDPDNILGESSIWPSEDSAKP